MKLHGGGEGGTNAAGPLDEGGCTWKRLCGSGARHAGSPPTPVSSLREIREGPERGMEKALEAGPWGRAGSAPGWL